MLFYIFFCWNSLASTNSPVPTKELEMNKESESTISDIEDYINKKYELAISSSKKQLLQEVATLVNPKRGK